MANATNPLPPGTGTVTQAAFTTVGNVSKALAASTSLLLRLAGNGTVAGALGILALLDSIPRVEPVTRDAGEPPAAPGTAADRPAAPEARDSSRAPKVIPPHVTEQVAHATAQVAAAKPAKELAVEKGPQVQPAQVDTPPIENWDNLTLASARARMRRLSLEDMRRLLAYERSHAERESVVSMLEKRIAKLQTGAA